MNFKIHVPVVGEISKNMIEFDGNSAKANLVMDEVMQANKRRNYLTN
jgi:hypothetical protein